MDQIAPQPQRTYPLHSHAQDRPSDSDSCHGRSPFRSQSVLFGRHGVQQGPQPVKLRIPVDHRRAVIRTEWRGQWCFPKPPPGPKKSAFRAGHGNLWQSACLDRRLRPGNRPQAHGAFTLRNARWVGRPLVHPFGHLSGGAGGDIDVTMSSMGHCCRLGSRRKCAIVTHSRSSWRSPIRGKPAPRKGDAATRGMKRSRRRAPAQRAPDSAKGYKKGYFCGPKVTFG